MGLFDSIKKTAKDITGLGLSADEQYKRAYQKGVFLNPPNYKAAAENFLKAAEKFAEGGNAEMVKRSQANAALYSFVDSKDRGQLEGVFNALSALTSIEHIGSETEMVETAPLLAELGALISEVHALSNDDSNGKASEYKQMGEKLLGSGNFDLQFVSMLQFAGPSDKSVT